MRGSDLFKIEASSLFQLVPRLQSGGGVSNDGRESYAATIVKSASYVSRFRFHETPSEN